MGDTVTIYAEEGTGYTYETAPRYVHPGVILAGVGLSILLGFLIFRSKQS